MDISFLFRGYNNPASLPDIPISLPESFALLLLERNMLFLVLFLGSYRIFHTDIDNRQLKETSSHRCDFRTSVMLWYA